MRKGDAVIVLALGLIAFAVAWAVAQEPPAPTPLGGVPLPDTAVTIGPVEQIGPTGFVGALSEDGKALCRDAPLNSFGSACEGYTWGRVGGAPKEFRTKRGGYPTVNLGFLPIF